MFSLRVAHTSNVDLIRPIYDEWERGNIRPRFDVYDPEMEWGWSEDFPDLGGVQRDDRDPNPRIRSWLSGWQEWRIVAEEYLEFDDFVVVLTRYEGRGKGSGVEIRQEGAHVFRLRNGKVVRLEIFASREKAIASVPTKRSAEGIEPANPMTDENVEVLRRLYRDWSRGDFSRLGRLLAQDVTFWSELPPGEVLCHGPEEIDSFFRDFLRQWRDYRIEGDEFIELDDHVVLVVGRQSGKGAQSGVQTEQPLSIVWTFRAGTVTRMHCAIDRASAVEAAGLSK